MAKETPEITPDLLKSPYQKIINASADAPASDMIPKNKRMALPAPGFNARFEVSYQF
ncbi:hypothetical protein E5E22_06765 [Helicobacter pylori]|nr:hypothetical protein E5E22_06765 [Helicobacter pylori]